MVDDAAYQLFCDRLPDVLSNDLAGEPQERIIHRDGVVSHYHSRDSLGRPGIKQIDLSWPPDRILRHVRALDFPPFEPAHAIVGGQKVFLTTGRELEETRER